MTQRALILQASPTRFCRRPDPVTGQKSFRATGTAGLGCTAAVPVTVPGDLPSGSMGWGKTVQRYGEKPRACMCVRAPAITHARVLYRRIAVPLSFYLLEKIEIKKGSGRYGDRYTCGTVKKGGFARW